MNIRTNREAKDITNQQKVEDQTVIYNEHSEKVKEVVIRNQQINTKILKCSTTTNKKYKSTPERDQNEDEKSDNNKEQR